MASAPATHKRTATVAVPNDRIEAPIVALTAGEKQHAPFLLSLAFQLTDLGSHVILEVIAQEVHRAPYRKCDLVNAEVLRSMMDITKNPEIVLVVVNPGQDLFLTEVLLVLAAVGVPLPEVR